MKEKGTIVISSQAMNVLFDHGVDKDKLVEKLQEVLSLFQDIPFPFHRVYVGKTTDPLLRGIGTDFNLASIHIDIYDSYSVREDSS
jgi:hypothetical protein